MTELHHDIKIDAPIEKVWSVLADLEAVQYYNAGVTAARYVSPDREGVGATRHCDFKMGGSAKERVATWEPLRTMTIEMYDHAWPLKSAQWRTELLPDGDGTLMVQYTTYEYTGDPAGAEAMREQWGQAIAAVTQSFKEYVEAGPAR